MLILFLLVYANTRTFLYVSITFAHRSVVGGMVGRIDGSGVAVVLVVLYIWKIGNIKYAPASCYKSLINDNDQVFSRRFSRVYKTLLPVGRHSIAIGIVDSVSE